MAIIISTISNKVEEFQRIEVLKEFTDKFINYLRDEQSNLEGFKILYDLNDIKGILYNVLRTTIINECKYSSFDEEDIPI